MLQTEHDFKLPIGFLDENGTLHRDGIMRLATAADEILPLKLSPSPRELVRVMVGRAEIIPPQLQRELAILVKLSNEGDAQAKERLQACYQKLGRFGDSLSQDCEKIQTLRQRAYQYLMEHPGGIDSQAFRRDHGAPDEAGTRGGNGDTTPWVWAIAPK